MAEIYNGTIRGSALDIEMVNFDLLSDKNNLEIGESGFVCLTNKVGVSVALTGIISSTLEKGTTREVILYNISTEQIVIENDSMLSTSGNRFFTKSDSNLTLNQFESASFVRIDVDGRNGWQQL